MPKQIKLYDDEIWLENTAENNTDSAKFMADDPEIIPFGKWTLLRIGNNIRVVIRENGKWLTIYHVKLVTKHKIQFYSQATQVEVWRDISNDSTLGLPKELFFEYLLPKYNCIVSDEHQTQDGERFWKARIYNALERGISAYYIDYNTREKTKIINKEHFKQTIIAQCWGREEKHRARRAAIILEDTTSE